MFSDLANMMTTLNGQDSVQNGNLTFLRKSVDENKNMVFISKVKIWSLGWIVQGQIFQNQF